jgi:O-antigen ligase
MSDLVTSAEAGRRPGTSARVLLFLLTLAGSWVLLLLGFPPGAPDRLPVLTIALTLALWTARRPEHGIVAFCFLFPCTGLLVRLFGGTDPSTWPALLFGGLAAGWTFRFIYDFESRPEPSAVDRPLAALLAVWCAATLLAVCRARTLWAIGHGLAGRAVNSEGLQDAEAVRESVFALSSLAAGAALFFLLRRAGVSLRARAVGAALWGVSASALAAGFQRIGLLPPETRGFWKLTGRLGGGAVDPNSLGLLCALVLVVVLTPAIRGGPKGGLEIGRSALWVAGLVLSGSRSGLLLLVLALLILMAARGVSPRVRLAGAVALAAVLIVIGLLVLRAAPGTVGGRLAESFDPKLPFEYRVSERPALWRAAMRLFRSHPLEGAGMGAFAWRLPDLVKEENRRLPMRDNPGSAYIQALAETGLIGFLVTVGFVVSLARQALAALRRPAEGASAGASVGLVAFLLTLAIGSHWFAPDVSLLFFLLASTVVASGSPERPAAARVARGAVWLYGAAAVAGMLLTARPEETFRYRPRIGFYAPEPGPKGPVCWTRRFFALWLGPGQSQRLRLAHFAPESRPLDVEAAIDGRIVWHRSLAPGEATHLILSGSSQRPQAVVFRVSRAFVPRRWGLSEDRRELGLLSAEE